MADTPQTAGFNAGHAVKIVLLIITPIAISSIAYFGFIKKYKDGLTGFQKLTGVKPKVDPSTDDGIGSTPESTTATTTTTSGAKSAPAANKPTVVPVNTPVSSTNFPIPMYVFGSGKTDDRVKQIQAKLGLMQDGKLGNDTATAIKLRGYSVPVSQADYTNLLTGLTASDVKSSYNTFIPSFLQSAEGDFEITEYKKTVK